MLMRVVVAVACIVLATPGCGGDDEAGPLTLEQRLLQPSDVPSGFDQDGQARRSSDVDAFVESIEETFIQATASEARAALVAAGFIGAAEIGFQRASDQAEIGSAVVDFESEDGAKDALEFRHTDALLPCRARCDIAISRFDVDDIPDAKGVQRSKTKESSAGAGPAGPLFDAYEVSFVDGRFLYVVRGNGPPGAVTNDEVMAAAEALYERVRGAPPPS